jgi:hypothetical protein
MNGSREHWNDIYGTKTESDLCWYQSRPDRALSLIQSNVPDKSTPIIDIGGGASRLADQMLADGYSDLMVLDISDAALARSKDRLGEAAHLI